MRDRRDNALRRLGDMRGLTFGEGAFALNHVVIRVTFATEEGKKAKVSVKIKPPTTASFKRHRFEARILELLRRNGLCHVRQPAGAAVAAE